MYESQEIVRIMTVCVQYSVFALFWCYCNKRYK